MKASVFKRDLKIYKTTNSIMDRAQTLGNFALASADAHDWPQAIAQLKEALQVCGDCSALPILHKDLGLIYCRAGDYKQRQDGAYLKRKSSLLRTEISLWRCIRWIRLQKSHVNSDCSPASPLPDRIGSRCKLLHAAADYKLSRKRISFADQFNDAFVAVEIRLPCLRGLMALHDTHRDESKERHKQCAYLGHTGSGCLQSSHMTR